MNNNLKPSLAEHIGTFTLMFIGAGAVWGAPVNPAIRLGLAVTGKAGLATLDFAYVRGASRRSYE